MKIKKKNKTAMLNAFKEIKKIVLRISAENWKLYKITKWKFWNFIYIYMIKRDDISHTYTFTKFKILFKVI